MLVFFAVDMHALGHALGDRYRYELWYKCVIEFARLISIPVPAALLACICGLQDWCKI